MSWQAIVFDLLVALLLVAVPPLGRYMAAVYGVREDGTAPGDRFFNPIERFIYRVCGIDHKREQRWTVRLDLIGHRAFAGDVEENDEGA